jgi:Putative MetA-pathway of phenol degradation
MTNLLKFSTISLAGFSAIAQAQSGPEVTPYRPGAGSPAILSATGYFEIEGGYDFAKAGGVKADTLGLTLKYGLSDQVGVFFGIPYLRVRAGGATERGIADSVLGLKWVNKLNAESAWGLQLTSTLPTGEDGFGSDNPSFGLTALYGVDFSGFHADLNLGARFAGDKTPGLSRNSFFYSAGLSRALGGGWGVGAELSGSRQSGAGTGTTVLGAVTYTVSKNLALDASLSRARAGGENANAFGVGMTYLFSK